MALTTAFYTLFHAVDFFAIVRAGLADFGTGPAIMRMEFAIAAHESDAGFTGGDTVKHQFDVFLLNVVTALGKARRGQHVADRCYTGLAIFNTV
ncbi:hypothetical protein [Roseiconus lacunae]|uniref:hypothetical protein n=1 Tax=Roseiconus lacunae TaxID=2605694 RepID=UPI0013DBB039